MRDFVATWRGEWPNTSTWPRVGYNSPRRILTVVDLPEPLGPSKPKTSPRRTSKSMPSTARALGRPQKSLKTLVRPRTAATTSDEGAGFAVMLRCLRSQSRRTRDLSVAFRFRRRDRLVWFEFFTLPD